MEIYCPNCALEISLDEGLFGSKGQCPRCSYKFVIEPDHRHPPDADDLGTAPTIKIVTDDDGGTGLGGPRKRWSDSWSCVATLAVSLLWVIAVMVTWAAGAWFADAGWTSVFRAIVPVTAYGAVSLLVCALLMEVLGRLDRFAWLHRSLPFVVTVAVIYGFAACVAAGVGLGGFCSRVSVLLGGLGLAGIGLSLSFHFLENPEKDRLPLFAVKALGAGALALGAMLG